MFLILCFFSLLILIGPIILGDIWLLELLLSFKSQIFIISLVYCGYALVIRRRKRVIILLGLLIAILAFDIPHTQFHKISKEAPSFTVASLNLWGKNKEFEKVNEYFLKELPDIVVFQELTGKWRKKLKKLEGKYGFSAGKFIDPSFMIGILSQYPILDIQELAFEDQIHRAVMVKIVFKGERIWIAGIHPEKPINKRRFDMRNQQLFDIGKRVQKTKHPVVIAGDFNTTPHSTIFKKLVKTYKLKQDLPFFHYHWTWPSYFPPLGVHIDHILAKGPIIPQFEKIGPHIGSDHRPIHYKIFLEN